MNRRESDAKDIDADYSKDLVEASRDSFCSTTNLTKRAVYNTQMVSVVSSRKKWRMQQKYPQWDEREFVPSDCESNEVFTNNSDQEDYNGECAGVDDRPNMVFQALNDAGTNIPPAVQGVRASRLPSADAARRTMEVSRRCGAIVSRSRAIRQLKQISAINEFHIDIDASGFWVPGTFLSPEDIQLTQGHEKASWLIQRKGGSLAQFVQTVTTSNN